MGDRWGWPPPPIADRVARQAAWLAREAARIRLDDASGRAQLLERPEAKFDALAAIQATAEF
jgi:hypothetical protein